MSINRIKALREKHAVADAQIRLLQIQPGSNQEKIRALKKEKLRCKDEIARLENPKRLTAPKKSRFKKDARTVTDADISTQVESPVSMTSVQMKDINLAA